MKKTDTKALVEGALLIAIAAVLMIASIYVPFFILFGIILWPIPVTILTFKYDWKFSILSLVVLFLLAAMLTDPMDTLIMILIYGTPSAVLGFCLRRKYSSFASIMAMTLSMFVMLVAVIKFSKVLTGQDFMALMTKTFNEISTKLEETLKNSGASDPQINTLLQSFNPDAISMVFPGILAMSALLGSFINYYVVGKVFKRLRISINELKPMDQWFIANNLSLGLFIITIAAWILYTLKVPNADVTFNSIYVIFNYVFVIDGLAVISWFLKKKGVPGKVTVLLIILLLFSPLGNLVFYLGLVDFIVDFRKINPLRRRKIPPGR